MSKNAQSARTKVAAFCRLIQSAVIHTCECGQEATHLVSMNVLKERERRFMCDVCFDTLPKATPFEEGSCAWMRSNVTRDIRMVNHAHTVGYGSGLTHGKAHGNGTAALKFED